MSAKPFCSPALIYLGLAGLAASGCTGRSGTVVAPPSWQSGAKIDPAAKATMRLHPELGARYLTCEAFGISFKNMKIKDPEANGLSFQGKFAITMFEEVAKIEPEMIEVRTWTGLIKLGLSARTPSTPTLRDGQAQTTLTETEKPVKITTRNAYAVPRKNEREDAARGENDFKLELPSSFADPPEFPEGPTPARTKFPQKKRDVVTNPSSGYRAETSVDQTWTFLGVEHKKDGDAWLFGVEGTFQHATRTDAIVAKATGEVIGGVRISARDGATMKGWYAMVGSAKVEAAKDPGPDQRYEVGVDLRWSGERRLYDKDEPFPAPFGGEFPHDPCAAWVAAAPF